MARVALVSAISWVNTATTQGPCVGGDHDAVRLVLGHAELGLQHAHDELARREVVVDEDHLVQAAGGPPWARFWCAAWSVSLVMGDPDCAAAAQVAGCP